MNAFFLVTLGASAIAVAIPLVVYLYGDRKAPVDPRDWERSTALPYIGSGVIPPERDRSFEQDEHSFSGILLLLLRSWPYIRPQLLGRWFIPGKGLSDEVAESVGGGYSLFYAPILVSLIAALGPVFGLMPASLAYPLNFLYLAAGSMVAGMWALAIPGASARFQTIILISLVFAGLALLMLGALVVKGLPSLLYAISVAFGCVLGWTVQFKLGAGRLQVRVRLRAHLAYLYMLMGLQGFIALTMGLVIADLLGQSLLQSDALMPALAEFFGRPELSRGVADGLTVEQRQDVVWMYIKLTFGMWLINLPIEIFRPYYNVWIMQRINQDLRVALVERWHTLSINYHSDHRTGDSIYRIYQDSAQVTAVIGQLTTIGGQVWGYFLAIILVGFLSPTLSLIGISLAIPAILWARWAMPRMRNRSLVYRAATSDVTSRIQESFAAIRLIKAYGAEEKAERDMEDDSIVAFNAAFQVRLLIAVVTIVMFSIACGFLLTGEFYMAIQANQGNPTFASEVIAVMGFSFVVWNLGAFNWTKAQFHETSHSTRGIMRQWLASQDMAMGLARVFDILDIEPDIKDAPDAITLTGLAREIRFDDVYFHYQPDRPVLEGVTFAAATSTVTAIVGPTGSGKSTLMGLLLRLYDPTAGTISIDGRPLTAYEVESVRMQSAIALQENVLFALSVRDNIRYAAPNATDAQVDEAVRIACMEDYVRDLPEGLDTVLGDRGGKLSTGQRQRLSIARAVVRDTPILILDEPTAALDAATEHAVMTNLVEWGQGRAIFLITHRISTIRRADNILYLDQGRIIESGDHAALMARDDGRYRSFVTTEESEIQTPGDAADE